MYKLWISTQMLLGKVLGTLYLVLRTIVSHVKKLSLRTCSRSTSKFDPAALFVFDYPQGIGNEGKIHEILWYWHLLELSLIHI
jgi:hypothetical protein